MADKVSFDAYMGWVNITNPNQIPEDARVISANDLLRYEKLGKDAAAKFAEIDTTIDGWKSDTIISDLIVEETSETRYAVDSMVKAGVTAGVAKFQKVIDEVPAKVQEQVTPLVAKAIAADGTIVDAAAAAVDGVVSRTDLVKGSDSRVMQEIGENEPVFSISDAAGRRSWVEVAADGGPTGHSATFIAPIAGQAAETAVRASPLTLSELPSTEENTFSITDSFSRRSWVEIGADGSPTSHSVGLLRAALALPPVDTGDVVVPSPPWLETVGESPDRKVWLHDNGSRKLAFGSGDAHNPRFSEDGTIIFATLASGDFFRPRALNIAAAPVLPSKTIVGTGDSLTAAGVFLKRIGAVLDVPTVNMGVAGWASADIAIRQGGLQPKLTLAGDAIPESGSVVVTSRDPGDGWRTGTTMVFKWTGTLAGVPGVLEHDHPAGNVLRFTRTTPGAAVACPAGTPFICTDGNANRDKIHLVFSGRNNVNAAQVVRDEKAIVAWLTPYVKQFLVVSVINGLTETKGTAGYANVMAVNNAKAAAFPDNYYDLRAEFISKGLALAGITPTAADNAAIAADTPPPSLMADNVHPNPDGYAVMGDLFAARITSKGWIA